MNTHINSKRRSFDFNWIFEKKQISQSDSKRKFSKPDSDSENNYTKTKISDDAEQQKILEDSPLSHLNVYVEIFSNGRNISETSYHYLQNLGAKAEKKLNKKCNLMIWKEGSIKSIQKAKSYGIPIVNSLWLEECIDNSYCADYKQYLAKLPNDTDILFSHSDSKPKKRSSSKWFNFNSPKSTGISNFTNRSSLKKTKTEEIKQFSPLQKFQKSNSAQKSYNTKESLFSRLERKLIFENYRETQQIQDSEGKYIYSNQVNEISRELFSASSESELDHKKYKDINRSLSNESTPSSKEFSKRNSKLQKLDSQKQNSFIGSNKSNQSSEVQLQPTNIKEKAFNSSNFMERLSNFNKGSVATNQKFSMQQLKSLANDSFLEFKDIDLSDHSDYSSSDRYNEVCRTKRKRLQKISEPQKKIPTISRKDDKNLRSKSPESICEKNIEKELDETNKNSKNISKVWKSELLNKILIKKPSESSLQKCSNDYEEYKKSKFRRVEDSDDGENMYGQTSSQKIRILTIDETEEELENAQKFCQNFGSYIHLQNCEDNFKKIDIIVCFGLRIPKIFSTAYAMTKNIKIAKGGWIVDSLKRFRDLDLDRYLFKYSHPKRLDLFREMNFFIENSHNDDENLSKKNFKMLIESSGGRVLESINASDIYLIEDRKYKRPKIPHHLKVSDFQWVIDCIIEGRILDEESLNTSFMYDF